jgi:fused signal recognition particle receptor
MDPLILLAWLGAVAVAITVIVVIFLVVRNRKSKPPVATSTRIPKLKLKTVEQKDLFDRLVQADFGVEMARTVVEESQKDHDLRQVLLEKINPPEISDRKLNDQAHPSVWLFVGVNGVGKTSVIGKLSSQYVNRKQRVLLGACDTFRAAASEQLETWAKLSGADIVQDRPGADPSSVAYRTLEKAQNEQYDLVLLDTAGRLQNRQNLMDELAKIKRVVEKRVPITETLLVLDANTGQNALAQAEAFSQIVNLTGIVLTKLDSSAKGGLAFSVQKKLQKPVKLLGVGESIGDLEPFNPQTFVDSLL